MKRDEYNLYEHYFYCTLVLATALIIIFMICLNNANNLRLDLSQPNTINNVLP